MRLIVLKSDTTAARTNVASQMTSGPKLAGALAAFKEFVSWQRRRN